MPTATSKRRKRGKIFIIALMALIFAETGYILGTTGLGPLIFSGMGGATATFKDVLAISTAYVFFNGTVSQAAPPLYQDAYVYVVLYQPGVALPDAVTRQIALDASEKPVYVLPIPSYNTPIDPHDFRDVLPQNAKNPVVLLAYQPTMIKTVNRWLMQVQSQLGQFQSKYVRVELKGGQPTGVRYF